MARLIGTTTYLLRDIDKNLWAKVKSISYVRGVSIRDVIVQELEEFVKREEQKREGERESDGADVCQMSEEADEES